jgi:hypothetical protein
MKTAIYIEDGVVQLVLTPETEFEKNSLTSFEKKPLSAKIFSGSFYDCRGGWTRQEDYAVIQNQYGFTSYGQNKSIILRIESGCQKKAEEKLRQG